MKYLILSVVAVALSMLGVSAEAAVINVAFPSASSTVVVNVGVVAPGQYGYFFNQNDSITQTFSGTGIGALTQLDMGISVPYNALSPAAFVNFDVLVNGTDVGDFLWTGANGTGVANLSFTNLLVAGLGPTLDNFTIQLLLTNQVPFGAGSIAIGFPGDTTLTGVPTPEPASMLAWGLIVGVGAVGYRLRKRQVAVVA